MASEGVSVSPEAEPNRERVLRTFIDLVKISSPTGMEEGISDHLRVRLSRVPGAEVYQDENLNVLVKIPGEGEPLFEAAHMDTVQPGVGIVPRVDGDVMTSEGDTILGADNKMTMAAILEALEMRGESQATFRPLEILFTTGEEGDGGGAKNFDYSNLSAVRGLAADIAEPVGRIVVASPAYIRFDTTITGQAGHAAYPERGVRITDALAKALQVPQGRLDEHTTLNIGIIEAGASRNAIPGSAVLRGEIRGFDDDVLEGHLRETIRRLSIAGNHTMVSVETVYSTDTPGYQFEGSDPYINGIAYMFRRLGIEPKLIRSSSVSDVNIFNNHGLQVVNIGDGTERTHSDKETARVSDMMRLAQIFHAFGLGKFQIETWV